MRFRKILSLFSILSMVIFAPRQKSNAQQYVGSCSVPGAISIWVDKDSRFAFVGAWGGATALTSVNIADPTNPLIVDSLDFGYYDVFNISVRGDYAFLSGWSHVLRIVNISNPNDLVSTSEWDGIYLSNHCCYVRGDCAFISHCQGLSVLDVSDEAHPVMVQHLNQGGDGYGLWIEGDYLYVAENLNSKFDIFDISTPQNPILLSSPPIVDYWPTWYLSSKDHYVYIPAEDGGNLLVVDATDPLNPAVVDSSIEVRGACYTFVLYNYLYVTGRYGDLLIFNILDRAHPVQVGSYELDRYCGGVFATDRYTYLAGDGQLIILEYDITSANDKTPVKPDAHTFLTAYPNPFNSATVITMDRLNVAEIEIYDIHGKKAATLIAVNGKATWNPESQSSGVYFARAINGVIAAKPIKLVYIK